MPFIINEIKRVIQAMKEQKIRVKLKAFDIELIDQSAQSIVESVKRDRSESVGTYTFAYKHTKGDGYKKPAC